MQVNNVRMIKSLEHLKFFGKTLINFFPFQFFLVHLFNGITHVSAYVITFVDFGERASTQKSFDHVGVDHLPGFILK